MTIELGESLFVLPSVMKFVENIVSKLVSDRVNVLIYLPKGLDPIILWRKLREELLFRGAGYYEIEIDHFQGLTPLDILSTAFRIDWVSLGMPCTIENFILSPELPQVIYIGGFDRLSTEEILEWSRFINNWAEITRRTNKLLQEFPLLCMISSGKNVMNHFPDSDISLSIHWWWNLPSILECRLLFRVHCVDETDSHWKWREHLLTSIALNDIVLLDYLWKCNLSDSDQVIELLSLYAQKQEWESGFLLKESFNNYSSTWISDFQKSEAPPKILRNFWAEGGLLCSEEFGIEINSAALSITNRKEEVFQRIWRSQIDLVLPLIDNYRLIICNYLTKRKGSNDWPYRWEEPIAPEEQLAVRQNPMFCSWGHLKNILYNENFSTLKFLLPLVKQGHYLRNEIAHCRPICFKDYEYFVTESASIMEKL